MLQVGVVFIRRKRDRGLRLISTCCRALFSTHRVVFALVLLLPIPGVAGEVVVKPGETLAEIADRYGTTVDRLMEMNGLRNANDLWAGSRIQVPGASPLISSAPALSLSREDIADIAKSITVRIEGASTPASGVLIKREGSRYTVLTAWHVVSDQNTDEELAIYTSDGRQHQLERGSIERVGNVDLAVMTFTSGNRHQIANLNTVAQRTGARIYLYGYPATTTSVPMRISRGSSGEIVGSTSNQSLNGYELMYSTQMPSMTGMSGGPVLDTDGNLIGIHARSETDQTQAVEDGVAIRSGMSQGVPITYFASWRSPRAVIAPPPAFSRRPAIAPAINQLSSSLLSWFINRDGILEIRTPPGSSLQAFFEEGRFGQGPRVWIDLPGAPRRSLDTPGNGAIRIVRVGKPTDNTTRLIIEFRPGTRLDPRSIRLVGTAVDRWSMDFGPTVRGLEAFGDTPLARAGAGVDPTLPDY